jgi:hypothetical protein
MVGENNGGVNFLYMDIPRRFKHRFWITGWIFDYHFYKKSLPAKMNPLPAIINR